MKRAVCVLGALLGGLALSQAPEYTQQYLQRLGGAVDELETIIERFDADAARSGLTRQEGLARYERSPEAFLIDRGASMRAVFARHANLSEQLQILRTAGPIERLGALTASFDTDVGAAALEDYRPAVPVTPEGAAHAGAGLLAGYGVLWALWTGLTAPFRRRKPRPAR